ncbi:MAG: saccharopine dehydrogenase family protein, partial [Bacteroidota bacterium]
MSKIVVLGAGMVGKAISIDLHKNHTVTAVDLDEQSLTFLSEKYNIHTQALNLMDEDAIKQVVSDCDLVVSAVPGFMGYDLVRTVIEARKNVVDISFMPEDYMDLNTLAARNGVTAITDCGVAPGMPNLIAGYWNELMEIESLEYHVGGLPRVK